MTSENEAPQKTIEDIRRFEFGIGASLEGDGEIVVGNMVRRYRNLLATIAEDLNSKESHFVLELVQNADDNDYRPGVAPSLSFSLAGNALVVENNERGFTPENVKALCSAGESSKKDKKGYIGEKGIGFKSVFKVTDAPEIHSNGFHFRFNRADPTDLLGYVVPHWHESDLPLNHAATTVVLPQRQGREIDSAILSDLDSTLLLFLDKLRDLHVRTPEGAVRYSRKDLGSTTTLETLRESPSGDISHKRYLRSSASISMTAIIEKKREGISSTDLVLAFPLSDSGEASPIAGCPTYAFLPIREFGFSFCIQGDFVLVSSREGLHEELPWNLRLRDSIAPAFVAAVETFKEQPDLARTYLRFLPSEGDVVDPFFKPVVQQLIAALRHAACIPVESGGWRKPTEVLLASRAIHQLFTTEDVKILFGAEYPAPELVAPDGALKRLGCRELLISDVVSVFTKHADWLSRKDVDWRARFYAYIATSPSRDDFKKGMLSVPCIPTSSGALATPKSSVVFYPLGSEQAYGFEHELTIIDHEVYEKALAIAPDVKALFDGLGVKHDNAFEMIRAHILPHHTDDALKHADLDALVGHVRYMRDRLEQYLALCPPTLSEADAIATLRDGLYIGSKRSEDGSWFFSRPTDLYISKEYRPRFNIEQMLGEKLSPGLLLSDRYIAKRRGRPDKARIAEDIDNWKAFFERIGVQSTPRVLNRGGNATCSDELKLLLESSDQAVRRETLECLDRNWSGYDTCTRYAVRTNRNSIVEQQTSFSKELRITRAPSKRRTAVSLDQAYHDGEEIREVFGGNLAFVDASFRDERFLKACGITYKADAPASLKRLRQIRTEGGATRDQVRKIYRRLEALWAQDRHLIEQTFRAEPLILARTAERTIWAVPGDLCWRPTGQRFLDAQHPPLNAQYVDHSNFFTKYLSVPHELPLGKWVDGLVSLNSVEDGAERAELALAIYRRLSRELGQSTASQSDPAWLERFQDEALFLDHRGQFVANSASLFANDAPDLAKLFDDVTTISLLAVPKEQLSAIASPWRSE
jgi:hypothetical protein